MAEPQFPSNERGEPTSTEERQIQGVLFFYEEQGTRGGYWAIQDNRYIRPNETCYVCRKCYIYWDKKEHPERPTGTHRVYSYPFPTVEPQICLPGTHEFELTSEESWSHDGLHVLEDGDQIAVHGKDDVKSVVWSGTICLRRYGYYAEKVFDQWIHADQEGVDREVWARWFFNGHPATLIKYVNSESGIDKVCKPKC